MRQLKITQQITKRDNDSLERYLSEIAREPMITAEQEVELAGRIRQGDEEALMKMTKANLRFVVSVAKQYQNQGLSLSDLINEGNIGLIKAATRFDESRGFKFISYAVWWIRQSILQALVENARLVRLPLNKVGSYSKLSKVAMKFEQKFEREPNEAELAELMQVTEKDIAEMKKGSIRSVSMDAPLLENEDATMGDFMISDDGNFGDKQMNQESLKKEIKRILSHMNSKEREIISMFYGVNGEQQISLDEIGHRMQLTKERVRQLREKAIRKMRRSASSEILKAYLGE